METGQVVIRKRGSDRIRRGHLWVYRSDVSDSKQAQPGDIVTVLDQWGGIVGKAFFSSISQIALRFLSRGDVTINQEFFQERFAAADRLR